MSEIAVTGPTLRREVNFRGGGFLEVPKPLYSWIAFAGIIAVWQASVSWGWIDPVFLPSPAAICEALWQLTISGDLWNNLSISLVRIGTGRDGGRRQIAHERIRVQAKAPHQLVAVHPGHRQIREQHVHAVLLPGEHVEGFAARGRGHDRRPAGLEHAGHHPGIRTGSKRTLLRPAQLCRRYHLHGFRDLPRIFYAANAPP